MVKKREKISKLKMCFDFKTDEDPEIVEMIFDKNLTTITSSIEHTLDNLMGVGMRGIFDVSEIKLEEVI